MNITHSEIASKVLAQSDEEVVAKVFDELKGVLQEVGACNALVALAAAYTNLMWKKFPDNEWEPAMTLWPHLVSQITEVWTMRNNGNHRRVTPCK